MVVGDDGDDVIIQGITDDLFDVTRTAEKRPPRDISPQSAVI